MAAKPAPPRIAIIENTPAGPLCRVTVVEGDELLLAGWLRKIKAGTVYPVVTKVLPAVAA